MKAAIAPVVGHAEPIAEFLAAAASGTMHHAWLLTGSEGVGKATFARAAALRLLVGGQVPGAIEAGLTVPSGHPARTLMEAGSHPDYRVLTRLPKDADKPDEELARSITIAQVRSLGGMFATAPSMGRRRVVVIDAIDDLERGGANALLKNLEEPPVGTIFLLVSHAPGRLLPTIRSRCRLLRFGRLDREELLTVLGRVLPDSDADEHASLADSGDGSPGRALRYAGLDVAGLDKALATLLTNGDPSNALRSQLARQLSGKAAQPRYAAFLDRAVSAIAEAARTRSEASLAAALDAYRAARDLAGATLGLSLDPAATVFEMAGIVAGLACRAA